MDKDLAKEFDKAVEAYNKYLDSVSNKKILWSRKLGYFFQGMGSIFGLCEKNIEFPYHPIYSKQDLTHEQKDAIILATDWNRTSKALDEVLGEEFSLQERKLVSDTYQHFRSVYALSRRK